MLARMRVCGVPITGGIQTLTVLAEVEFMFAFPARKTLPESTERADKTDNHQSASLDALDIPDSSI
jgi:hypothetical protein